MAHVMLEHGSRRALVYLENVVQIGSSSQNHLVINDPDVLPLHVAILRNGNGHVLEDRSQGLTCINNHPVVGTQLLQDRDQISVGSARLTFFEKRDDARPLSPPNNDHPGAGGAEMENDEIVSFSCSCCGKKLRAKASLAGRKGKCNKCQHTVTIPARSKANGAADSAAVRPPFSPATPREPVVEVAARCTVCRTNIAVDAKRIKCTICKLLYCDECWTDNFGCATYGCENVNILKKGPDITIGDVSSVPEDIHGHSFYRQMSDGETYVPTVETFPWEYIFLAASTFCALISLVMFGIPSLFVVVCAAVWHGNTKQPPKKAVLVALYILCSLATLVGFITSCCM